MNLSTDPVWRTWVGTTLTLVNGRTGTVRMAQHRCAADRLWVVDSHGTMHELSRPCGPTRPGTPPRLQTPSMSRRSAP